MGCGVSKHGSQGKGRNNSVEDSYNARRQRISVRIGAQVKKLDNTPNIIFIFGKKSLAELHLLERLRKDYYIGTTPVMYSLNKQHTC